jgi:hypothetical protein
VINAQHALALEVRLFYSIRTSTWGYH